MDRRQIQMLLVKSELGAGTLGASLGIDAIKYAALEHDSDFFFRYPTIEHRLAHEFPGDDTRHPHARYIHRTAPFFQQVAESVKAIRQSGQFPLIFSGDHFNAASTISGLRLAEPELKLGIVWIDAHADIHSPYTTPSGNLHGMPIGLNLGLGAEQNPNDNVRPETRLLWDKMCRYGDMCPKIDYRDMVYVGIRDLEDHEWDLIRKHRILHFTSEDVSRLGTDYIIAAIRQHFEGYHRLYVSFDVDSIDDSLVSGTGTPSPDGLTYYQVQSLLSYFWNDNRLAAFEVTEINPLLDIKNATAEIVFELLTEMMDQQTI